MYKINGKILVKETGMGIPNLQVVIYDLDVIPQNPTGEREFFSPTIPPPAEFFWQRFPGNRLGSVLSDANGQFEIIFEDKDFIQNEQIPRPDLVLFVLAPEDSNSDRIYDGMFVPNPPPQRVLHYSYDPVANAGTQESYIIRLSQELLRQFDILLTEPTRTVSTSSQFLHSMQRARELETTMRQNEMTFVQENVRNERDISARASNFVSNFSAAPVHLRDNPLFVGDVKNENVRARMATAITMAGNQGQLRMEEYRSRAQPVLQARLTDARLEELIRRGHLVPDGDGYLVHSVCTLMSGNNGINLQRVRSLLDEINSRLPPPDTGSGGGDDVDPPEPVLSAEEQIRQRILGQMQHLETPSVGKPSKGVMNNLLDMLKEMKSIEQGPADIAALRYIHALQIALPHVWAEAFDGRLRSGAEELYRETVRLHEEYGIDPPPLESLRDINDYNRFLSVTGGDRYFIVRPVPAEVAGFFPEMDVDRWNALSPTQMWQVMDFATGIGESSGLDEDTRRQRGLDIINNAQGRLGNIQKLMYEMEQMQLEPYAFHYFGPDTYNFGLLTTYTHEWKPITYQVGDLVSALPLAPGESRNISHKQVIKTSRSQKEMERFISSRQEESQQALRAEDEILNRAQMATNFQMTVQGALNFGIGQIGGSSQFALNQAQESSRIKKSFREAAIKATYEYKSERSIELESQFDDELELASSSVITNTNNELTVTYLFYELERRYQITEKLHQLTPVIMIAQDMPAPHEINEAWLLVNGWMLADLLPDTLKPGLKYLSDGFVGNEVSYNIKMANWKAHKDSVAKLENDIAGFLDARNQLRDRLANLTERVEQARGEEPDDLQRATMAVLSGGLTEAFGGFSSATESERFEALRRATEMRLEYLQESLADTRSKYSAGLEALNQATAQLSKILEERTNKKIWIDQVKAFVKQNILPCMHKIWGHESRDQRYFRLYHKPVNLPDRSDLEVCRMRPATPEEIERHRIPGIRREGREYVVECAPPLFPSADAVSTKTFGEIADLDNPLGFKGNYIIFPLKECTYLTDFMMQEYVDDYFGIRDPDEAGNFTTEELLKYAELAREEMTDEERSALDRIIAEHLTNPRRDSDTIVVPTGQLFIEALPGAHSLLEPFKMLHRGLDVAKVEAEVREANLDNLRRAARLIAGEREDPEIDKKIVVEGRSADIIVSSET